MRFAVLLHSIVEYSESQQKLTLSYYVLMILVGRNFSSERFSLPFLFFIIKRTLQFIDLELSNNRWA